jgi:photosystem II stability/assembly factor-like uncharacterized protein
MGRPDVELKSALTTATLLFLGVVLLTAMLGCGKQGPQFGPPLPTPTQLTPTPVLKARPGSHVWILGISGSLLSTSNGGAAWKRRQLPEGPEGTAIFSAIAFADATHGWVVGWDGEILATTDGGATWTPQHSSAAELRAVACTDARHVWAVGSSNGGAVIVSSADGGTTWTTQGAGFAGSLVGVAFADSKHGWAVGTKGSYGTPTGVTPAGRLLATSDGGLHWHVQVAGKLGAFGAVACSDARHLWVAGGGASDPSGQMFILASSDGGRSWEKQQASSVGGVSSLVFADRLHGWFVGSYAEGLILATRDGGRTWVRQHSGLPPEGNILWAVACRDT